MQIQQRFGGDGSLPPQRLPRVSDSATAGAVSPVSGAPSPAESQARPGISGSATSQQAVGQINQLPTAVGQPPVPERPRAVAGGGFRGGPVSFNFDDADVYSVVQTVLGDLLRVNYVVDPKVKGRVTFRSVAPVPRDNVLSVMEVILRLNGIGIVEEAGIYRIIQITDIAKEPAPIQFGRDPEKVVVTGKSLLQVVPILNIQSTEIVKLISSFVSTNAVLIDVPRGNHIIVVDTDANVKRLLELVQIFDGEQFKKRKGEVYVYPVQNSKAKDVTSLLQQIFLNAPGQQSSKPATSSTAASRPGSPPAAPTPSAQSAVQQIPTVIGGDTGLVSELTRIFADEVTNSVVVVGTPEDYSIIKETIQKIDILPRQVVIEGIIAEITLTDKLSMGLAYSLKTNFSHLGIKGQIGLNPSELPVTDTTTLSGSGFTFMGVDSGGTVRAMISALASESKGKLLAAPHILVADNREAQIQVGQQVPIVTSTTDYSATSAAGASTQTIQYKDIGIILKVKPQVNESGLVALELNQEISSYSTTTLYTNSTQIILNKTEAKTNLVVADGETIIIGGLIRKDTSHGSSGVPFLHKIPILGYLFGEKSKDDSRREMVILLTPHVIKTQEQARDVTKSYVDKLKTLGPATKDNAFREKLGIGGFRDKGGK